MGSTETVTVLFTDVVAVDRLARRAEGPEAAERVRQEHVRALPGHGRDHRRPRGQERAATGSWSPSPSAASAVGCGVEMQRRVAALGASASLRVGIATGDADVDGDDLFGWPVVESARLCAAATGGQILASDLVCLLAGGRGGHEYESIGDLALKGFEVPVPVREVALDARAVERADARGRPGCGSCSCGAGPPPTPVIPAVPGHTSRPPPSSLAPSTIRISWSRRRVRSPVTPSGSPAGTRPSRPCWSAPSSKSATIQGTAAPPVGSVRGRRCFAASAGDPRARGGRRALPAAVVRGPHGSRCSPGPRHRRDQTMSTLERRPAGDALLVDGRDHDDPVAVAYGHQYHVLGRTRSRALFGCRHRASADAGGCPRDHEPAPRRPGGGHGIPVGPHRRSDRGGRGARWGRLRDTWARAAEPGRGLVGRVHRPHVRR